MAQEYPRTRRVGEQIRRELAQLLRAEVRDPRIVMVSITMVNVSRDLAHARVYFTFLGDADERGDVTTHLNQLAPMLRRELGRLMRIRTIPKLDFVYDEAVEKGARLYSLITHAVAEDNARHEDDDGESR